MGILDLFFPTQAKCIFCRSEVPMYGICDECYKKLPIIHEPVCEKCGGKNSSKGKVCIECKDRQHSFDRCYSILNYQDDIRTKIISFKQTGNKYIGEAFAWLIEEKYKELNLNEIVDIIIPIPINENRLKERGFNQSEILCNQLVDTEKVNISVIVRTKDTPHQTGLSREHRETNLKDSFKVVDKKLIKNKVVLLVDDIYTTGSTLNEVADTLLKAGAKKVYALCLARTPVISSRLLDD